MDGETERLRVQLPRRKDFTICRCRTKTGTLMNGLGVFELQQKMCHGWLRERQMKGGKFSQKCSFNGCSFRTVLSMKRYLILDVS